MLFGECTVSETNVMNLVISPMCDDCRSNFKRDADTSAV